jgi:hypothetical protein
MVAKRCYHAAVPRICLMGPEECSSALARQVMHDRASWAYTAAIVGGAVLWLVTTGVTGNREAWDSSVYWAVAYPLAIGLAGGLGYWVPEKPWRWGLAAMLAQAVMLALAGSDFSLLPLGLILFSILALPAIGLAWLMARIRLRGQRS